MGYHQDLVSTEGDGVNVGGWSVRHLLWPKKANGVHDSSEDRAAHAATVETDWSAEEERALVRKLDMRVLFPCFLVYFFGYLDRGNMGNVKILQPGTDHNISKALHLVGRDFNWAVSVTYFPVVFCLIPSNLIVKKASSQWESIRGKLNGVKGLDSWQWVFIIEGAVTILMALPAYFLLLTFPETSVALNERRKKSTRQIPNRKQAYKTWDWAAARAVLGRPSTYIFFVSFHSMSLVGISQAIFTPTILHEFVGFSPQKANVFMAFIYFYTIPLYWCFPRHSDWTRERMWHFVLPILFALPCYATWTHASAQRSFGGMSGLSIYGLAYLGHLTSIAQPVMLSYRSSTLYGSTEQAVGGGLQIASQYLASIISPQMYPDSDAPWYLPAFTATVCLLSLCVLLYLSLPAVLLWEAKGRKAKYGHAMPRQAIEDAKRSQAAALRLHRCAQSEDDDKKNLTQVVVV
ncbi:hypothetical protein PG999_002976 [Apiospora kogelbergensis]|uniref:MFS general substrate transporter n=1 Tax=Apiospora kogelbergensis TaxID=1337665 RepID=A0AAW0R9Z6_9PEZI